MSSIIWNLNKPYYHTGALDISIDIFELSVHSHYKTQVLPCLQSKHHKKATNGEKKYGREAIKEKMKDERAKQWFGWFNFFWLLSIRAYLYTQVPAHI